MNVDTCIRGRRSCHSYRSKDVPLDVIGEIIEAGTYAPSAGNRQTWHFIVVKDEGKREKLAQLSHDQTWMIDAPVHIVICNDQDELVKWFGEKGTLYGSQNCAVAASLIMMKAEEAGLGSCWVGGFDEQAARELLSIPEHITPEIIITLGYPDRLEREAERRSVHDVTSFETYGKSIADLRLVPLKKHVEKLEKKKNKMVKKGLHTLKGLEGKLLRS